MEEQKNEEGLSLGEIFRVIFKKIWWVVGITLSVAAVTVLCIILLVNNLNSSYRMDYTLEFPGYENMRYPDGTSYRYQRVVSLEELERVKETDEAFASINVEKMYQQNDISITVDTENKSSAFGYYTLTVKSGYFANSDVATRFLVALASTPIAYINDVVQNADYGFYLQSCENATTYEDKIIHLANQRKYLVNKYSELILTYGESYRYEDKTLSAYVGEVMQKFSEATEKMLSAELKANGYVFDKTAYTSEATIKIAANNIKIEENEKVIDALEALPSVSEAQAKRIVTLTEENAVLAQENEEIERILLKLDEESGAYKEGNTGFAARLEGYRTALSQLTAVYQSVCSFIYETESDIRFDQYTADTMGTINPIVSVGLGVVLGFVVACVAVGIKELPKYAKQKKAQAVEQA